MLIEYLSFAFLFGLLFGGAIGKELLALDMSKETVSHVVVLLRRSARLLLLALLVLQNNRLVLFAGVALLKRQFSCLLLFPADLGQLVLLDFLLAARSKRRRLAFFLVKGLNINVSEKLIINARTWCD